MHVAVEVDGKEEVKKMMRHASPDNRAEKQRSITSVITALEIAMFALKLTQIGNSVGVVLPKEALAMLHIDKGDTVYLVETPEGFSMTPYDLEVGPPWPMRAANSCASIATPSTNWPAR